MRFRVLGPAEIVGPDGRQVAVGGRRQRTLLAALLARAGTTVSADTLAELIWGDDQPDNPANAVQVLVSRLRKSARDAGAPLEELHTQPSGYVLTADADQVDALRFARLVDEAKGAEPEQATGLLEEALSLWRGEPFVDAADFDPARHEAIRLEELRLSAIETLGEALVSTGRADRAIALIEPLLDEHPFRERGRSILMRALYAEGRQTEALATYSDYRERLADELGLEPSAALQRLEVDILRHEVPAAGGEPAPGIEPGGLDRLAVRYIDHAGGRVALAETGSGPSMVVVPAWVTSLDVVGSGRDPRSSLLERLAAHHHLILYDRRGSGLTGGTVDDYGTGASTDELEAVIEATGGPVTLLAVSQSGPVAIALAARRPELVDRLVLFGTYASAREVFTDEALSAAILDLVRSNWGMGSRLLAGLYRPDVSDAASAHLAGVLRDSASAEVAAGYLESIYAADESDAMSRVEAPALVIHYRGDRVIPFAGAQQLAGGLPDARLIALDGDYHLPDARDLDRIVAAIAEFASYDPNGGRDGAL